jgi:hypothetical protein
MSFAILFVPCVIRVTNVHNVPSAKEENRQDNDREGQVSPRPRAPILPSKKFEDKRRRDERRETQEGPAPCWKMITHGKRHAFCSQAPDRRGFKHWSSIKLLNEF